VDKFVFASNLFFQKKLLTLLIFGQFTLYGTIVWGKELLQAINVSKEKYYMQPIFKYQN